MEHEGAGEQAGKEQTPEHLSLISLVAIEPKPIYTATDKLIDVNNRIYFIIRGDVNLISLDQLIARLWGLTNRYWRAQENIQIKQHAKINPTTTILEIIEGDITWIRDVEHIETLRNLAQTAFDN